jgi:hypothetical protein
MSNLLNISTTVVSNNAESVNLLSDVWTFLVITSVEFKATKSFALLIYVSVIGLRKLHPVVLGKIM